MSRPVGHPSFVWCFVGFLVANMFSGHTSGLGLPVGPDRLLFGAAVVLFLLDRRYRVRSVQLRAVHACAAGVVVIAALSALATDALSTSLGFFALLDRLVIPYLVFSFAAIAFERREDRILLLKTMACMGIYLGLTAIAELVGPKALVFPSYIVDPTVGIQFGRARGPFAESEANGLTLLAAGHCALALTRTIEVRWWQRLARVAVAISFLGSLLTLTRSIWLGLALGMVLVAILEPRLRKSLGVILVVGSCLLAVLLLAPTSLASKATQRATYSRSVDDRRNTNAAAIRGIEQHPLTGVGWTRFIAVSDQYVRQDPNYPVTRTNIEVHNVVLSRAVELGIPGCLLWLASVALGPGLAAVRRPRTPDGATWRLVLVGTLSAWSISVLTSPLPYPLPNTLVWLFAGLAASTAIGTTRAAGTLVPATHAG